MKISAKTFLLGLVASLLVIQPDIKPTFAAVTAPGNTTSDSHRPAPSDTKIAAILIAVNDVEVDTAKLAKSKTKNPQVVEFAEFMIKEHTASNKKVHTTLRKLGMHPENSETTAGIKQNAKEDTAKLKKLETTAFDKAYVDMQVAAHKIALSDLDNNLIPNASTVEMKALLQEKRKVVATHLVHATSLQNSLWPTPKQ